MEEQPSQEELETAHCWEAADRVPGQAAMTIEDLLDSHALPKATETALRARYLVT